MCVSFSKTRYQGVKGDGEVQGQLDAIAQEFGMSPKQAEALKEYVDRDGLEYVLEKAAIVRSRPRGNAVASFIGALRGDWKKPVPVVIAKPKLKPKALYLTPSSRRKNRTLDQC